SRELLRWPESLAAAKRAKALMTVESGDTELRRRVDEAVADAQMIVDLEEIHARKTAPTIEVDQPYWEQFDREYARAFREYGIDVAALPTGEAAERVKSRAICVELVATLDEWALMRRRHVQETTGPTWQHLLDISRASDGEEAYRNELRSL